MGHITRQSNSSHNKISFKESYTEYQDSIKNMLYKQVFKMFFKDILMLNIDPLVTCNWMINLVISHTEDLKQLFNDIKLSVAKKLFRC